MIIDLQKRIMECGRIRIGKQVPTGRSGKTRPEKLTTFRLTSADRTRIEQAAQLYGGDPAEWSAPSGRQWEVVTTVDAIPVIVPPASLSFSMHYELWSAGGCQRRCDGATESIQDRSCPCDPDARECSIHTRLSVMIRDLPGLGVWRLDTQGYYAAVELQGAVEVIQAAAGRGAMLPARLRLEQRQVKRFGDDGKPQTRNFAVPVIDLEVTPAQLLGGGAMHVVELSSTGPAPDAADAPAIEPGATPALPEAPRLTPVPADTTPPPSMAEQVAPPDKPRRANAAAEIPSSGRSRRDRAMPDPDAVTSDDGGDGGQDDDGRMTQDQQRQLMSLLRQAEVGDRNTYFSGLLGRDVTSMGQLTGEEATKLIENLSALADDATAVGQ